MRLLRSLLRTTQDTRLVKRLQLLLHHALNDKGRVKRQLTIKFFLVRKLLLPAHLFLFLLFFDQLVDQLDYAELLVKLLLGRFRRRGKFRRSKGHSKSITVVGLVYIFHIQVSIIAVY